METSSSESLNLVQLLEKADSFLRKSKMQAEKMLWAEPFLEQLMQRMSISHEEAIALCCAFNLNDFSDISPAQLCRYFDCRPLQVMELRTALNSLCEKGLLYPFKSRMERTTHYVIPEKVVEAVMQNKMPEKKNYEGLTAEGWIEELDAMFKAVLRCEMTSTRLPKSIAELVDSNPQLQLAKYVQQLHLDDDSLVFLMATMRLFVCDGDDGVMSHDVDDFIDDDILSSILHAIRRGIHPFIKAGILENGCLDGRVDFDTWKLTEAAKRDWLCELELNFASDVKVGLKQPDSIAEKQLYFNPAVSKQVEQLKSLLMPERLSKVQERLAKHNMRCGFACIFYGGPGTGKTETAYQLAKATGRAVMQVDIPNMRSKWVGDTEKNIKATFDRYRDCCKKMPVQPILLFNEADAILGKRSTDTEKSVDKMENAMQNIILQEMETLDGIMIATTNLTGNLDSAFERRFLYKIEFPKPTPQESRHIWHAMLPELADNDALALAQKYNFSGGQIENIARKQVIHNILDDIEGVDMSSIQEACDNELINKRQGKAIGFC